MTFIAYVSVHAGRKALTNTKSIATVSFGVDPKLAGALDAMFMLAYAIGLVKFGKLGDTHSPKKLLCVSLIGMSVVQILFACMCVFGFARFDFGCVLLCAVWILNGLVQSLAWPCCVKLVGQCLNESTNSTVFSIWACNGIFGNIFCSIIASIVLNWNDENFGFMSVFLLMSFFNIISALLVARNIQVGNELTQMTELTGEGTVVATHVSNDMSLKTCLGLTGVLDYSLCHAFVKGVAYAMFFWLPFYLVKVHGVSPSAAAATSIWYDFSTIIGGPICGLLVEKTNKPALVISVFVLLAAGPQFLIDEPADAHVTTLELVSSNNHQLQPPIRTVIPTVVFANIILSGFFVGGVLNVLSAAVCAKIGGATHTSMVTGVIDGLGSFGASATQVVIPLIGINVEGWGTVFALLGVMLVASAATLFRVTRDELKEQPRVEYQIQH